MAMLFDSDDAMFLCWTAEFPEGYVVNLRRRLDPSYVVLHRANCRTLKTHRNAENSPGGFTERNYVKACSETVTDLEAFVADRLGIQRPFFSKRCSACDP